MHKTKYLHLCIFKQIDTYSIRDILKDNLCHTFIMSPKIHIFIYLALYKFKYLFVYKRIKNKYIKQNRIKNTLIYYTFLIGVE